MGTFSDLVRNLTRETVCEYKGASSGMVLRDILIPGCRNPCSHGEL